MGTERPDTITGTVTYWNGQSGWIKRHTEDGQTTAESHDVCVRVEDIASGTIANGAAVSFWFDGVVARDVKSLTTLPPEPEPEPDSPPAPDSPPP